MTFNLYQSTYNIGTCCISCSLITIQHYICKSKCLSCRNFYKIPCKIIFSNELFYSTVRHIFRMSSVITRRIRHTHRTYLIIQTCLYCKTLQIRCICIIPVKCCRDLCIIHNIYIRFFGSACSYRIYSVLYRIIRLCNISCRSAVLTAISRIYIVNRYSHRYFKCGTFCLTGCQIKIC